MIVKISSHGTYAPAECLDPNIPLGSLPSELGMLKSLNILGLHNNNFSDSVPHEIWHLTQLSALYLDGNNFKGEIPTDVNNLIMLADLRLRNNKFNGTLPEMGDLCKFFLAHDDVLNISSDIILPHFLYNPLTE